MAKKKPIKKRPIKTYTKTSPKHSPTSRVKKELPYAKYLPYLVLALILVLLAIIRSKFINIPFERDEGTYCYYGQLILDGKVPFRDFFEMKFPGLFYAYAAILGIFGSSLEQIQTGFIFVSIITTASLFFISRRIFSNAIALIITVAYVIVSVAPHASGFTVQAEHLMMLFVMGGLALLMYAINSNNAVSFFISGVLLSFSFMIKQSGVFFILFGGLAVLAYYLIKKDESLKRGIVNALIYSAGVVVLFGVFMILMYSYGVMDEMKYWIFTRASAYVSKNSFSVGMEFLNNIFQKNFTNYEMFWTLGIFGVIAMFFIRISLYKKIILIAFAVLSFLTIVPGFRFLGHYWIQTLPALAILIGISLLFFVEMLSKIMNKQASQILIYSAFVIVMIIHLNNNKKYYFYPDHTEVLREVYQLNPFPEAKVLGDFIGKNSDENDKIAVVGSEPQVHIYSGRRNVSEYQYYFSVLMSDTIEFPESIDRQQAFLDDIQKEEPKYMVVFRHRNSIWASPNGSYMIFNKFDEITNNDYKLVCFVDMISNFKTNYIWFDDLNNYEPSGPFSILLFERKEKQQ